MTSPESGSREPTTKAGREIAADLGRWSGEYAAAKRLAIAIESEAVERFAEALVRAVEEAEDPWFVEGAKDDDPRDDWCRKRDILDAISRLRSTPPATPEEPT